MKTAKVTKSSKKAAPKGSGREKPSGKAIDYEVIDNMDKVTKTTIDLERRKLEATLGYLTIELYDAEGGDAKYELLFGKYNDRPLVPSQVQLHVKSLLSQGFNQYLTSSAFPIGVMIDDLEDGTVIEKDPNVAEPARLRLKGVEYEDDENSKRREDGDESMEVSEVLQAARGDEGDGEQSIIEEGLKEVEFMSSQVTIPSSQVTMPNTQVTVAGSQATMRIAQSQYMGTRGLMGGSEGIGRPLVTAYGGQHRTAAALHLRDQFLYQISIYEAQMEGGESESEEEEAESVGQRKEELKERVRILRERLSGQRWWKAVVYDESENMFQCGARGCYGVCANIVCRARGPGVGGVPVDERKEACLS